MYLLISVIDTGVGGGGGLGQSGSPSLQVLLTIKLL